MADAQRDGAEVLNRGVGAFERCGRISRIDPIDATANPPQLDCSSKPNTQYDACQLYPPCTPPMKPLAT